MLHGSLMMHVNWSAGHRNPGCHSSAYIWLSSALCSLTRSDYPRRLNHRVVETSTLEDTPQLGASMTAFPSIVGGFISLNVTNATNKPVQNVVLLMELGKI